LDDRGAGHHRAFGHLGVGGLSDGVGARRVAAAAATGRGDGQAQVFVCSHRGFPSCCVMTVGQAFTGSRAGAGPAGAGALSSSARALKVRNRRLLETTNTDDSAMAAPASIGLSSPKAASGIAAVL